MNATLLRGLLALLPTCMLLVGSLALLSRDRSASSFLQVAGAACLVVVALTHIVEALHLFSWMHWGRSQSAGHYLDFSSAILGMTLFPLGYFLRAFARRRA